MGLPVLPVLPGLPVIFTTSRLNWPEVDVEQPWGGEAGGARAAVTPWGMGSAKTIVAASVSRAKVCFIVRMMCAYERDDPCRPTRAGKKKSERGQRLMSERISLPEDWGKRMERARKERKRGIVRRENQ